MTGGVEAECKEGLPVKYGEVMCWGVFAQRGRMRIYTAEDRDSSDFALPAYLLLYKGAGCGVRMALCFAGKLFIRSIAILERSPEVAGQYSGTFQKVRHAINGKEVLEIFLRKYSD